MAAPPLVVVGASAGGVEALTSLLRELPTDFPAAVLVVMHLAAESPEVLPRILARRARMTVLPARDGAVIEGARAPRVR